MKVTDLAEWNTLTVEEQARLRDMYQVGSDDELPESLTTPMEKAEAAKTPPPAPATKSTGKTTVITPKAGSTVTVNAESVTVHEKGTGVEGTA